MDSNSCGLNWLSKSYYVLPGAYIGLCVWAKEHMYVHPAKMYVKQPFKAYKSSNHVELRYSTFSQKYWKPRFWRNEDN